MSYDDDFFPCQGEVCVEVFTYLVTKNKCPGEISVRFFLTPTFFTGKLLKFEGTKMKVSPV